MSFTVADEIALTRAGDRLTVTTRAYSLEIPDSAEGLGRSPYARLYDGGGARWSSLNLFSGVDTEAAADETWRFEGVQARESGTDVVVTVTTRSTAWAGHTLSLRCTPAAVELTVTVRGSGRITDVTLFGGRGSRPSGASGVFRSGIDFQGLLAPVPTGPVQVVRPARSAAVLGVVGDADPGRLNAIFSPPPLVFGLSRQAPVSATDLPAGDWLGLGLRAPVDALTFTALRYEPLDGGFLLRLEYEGHTVVDGEWTSPAFVLQPAESGWDVIGNYRDDLAAHGLAPAPRRPGAQWWGEPIFCGWGAQCARAVRLLHADSDTPPEDPDVDTVPETEEEEQTVARVAPTLATEAVYDDFLLRLEEHDLRPGTIVIDDRWQAQYGTATVNLGQWPDLAGWIARRHERGQKVLLWWKAWDPEGLPEEECVLDAGGRPVAVDPASPAYRSRLRRIVSHLLSPEGLDADGFKVDFTQRSPSGRSLTATAGAWGIAGLHLLLQTLYREAKAAKPDALVICHTVHPSFGDVCDMVRLNDVLKRDIRGQAVPVVDQLRFRHAIATRTLPEHLIDTDQWPMPTRAEWLEYSMIQPTLGVPSLYYLESIDRSGEHIPPGDLDRVAGSWARYREATTR